MGLKNNPHEHEDTIFATVLADGKIHVSAKEGDEGAVKRNYATDEDKKSGSEKKTGVKWEFLYTELTGMIQKVDFFEGDFGINLQVVVGDEDDEKPITLSLSTSSNYAEDLMKKLPAINLKKPVKIAPYAFEDGKTGKMKKGVTVTQPNKKGEAEKIQSFYYDADKKANINKYPPIPKSKSGKALTKTEWRKYFAACQDFLIEDITERFHIEEANSKTKADKEFEDF